MNASKKTSSARCIIKKLFIIRKRIHGWTHARVRYGYILLLYIMLYTIAAAGVRFSVLRQTCANIPKYTDGRTHIYIPRNNRLWITRSVAYLPSGLDAIFPEATIFFFLQNSGTLTPFTAINWYIYLRLSFSVCV